MHDRALPGLPDEHRGLEGEQEEGVDSSFLSLIRRRRHLVRAHIPHPYIAAMSDNFRGFQMGTSEGGVRGHTPLPCRSFLPCRHHLGAIASVLRALPSRALSKSGSTLTALRNVPAYSHEGPSRRAPGRAPPSLQV